MFILTVAKTIVAKTNLLSKKKNGIALLASMTPTPTVE